MVKKPSSKAIGLIVLINIWDYYIIQRRSCAICDTIFVICQAEK